MSNCVISRRSAGNIVYRDEWKPHGILKDLFSVGNLFWSIGKRRILLDFISVISSKSISMKCLKWRFSLSNK